MTFVNGFTKLELIKPFAALLGMVLLVGCGSSHRQSDSGQDPNSYYYLYEATPEPRNSKAHPASYVTDRFPAHRPIKKSKEPELPFFYKKCHEDRGAYPAHSRVSYTCTDDRFGF